MLANCVLCGKTLKVAVRTCLGEMIACSVLYELNPCFLISFRGQARPRTGSRMTSYSKTSEKLTFSPNSGPPNTTRGVARPIPTKWSFFPRRLTLRSRTPNFQRSGGGTVSTTVSPPEKPPFSALYGVWSTRTDCTASRGTGMENEPVTGSVIFESFTWSID